MSDAGFTLVNAMLKRNQEDDERPHEFTLLGRTWELMDGVFSPTYTPATGLFSSWMPYPEDGTFLEIGSGTGVTAVTAAQAGCRAVTALDIAAASVENTRRNVQRHGVGDRVRVLRSDLFSVLEPGESFDMIYWNSNFGHPPDDFVNETELHHAFFDPRYETHRRFVREAPAHLTEGGRLLLGFSTIGNMALLTEVCEEAGFELKVFQAERLGTGGTTREISLLELVRA